jgi:hypothetical protein
LENLKKFIAIEKENAGQKIDEELQVFKKNFDEEIKKTKRRVDETSTETKAYAEYEISLVKRKAEEETRMVKRRMDEAIDDLVMRMENLEDNRNQKPVVLPSVQSSPRDSRLTPRGVNVNESMVMTTAYNELKLEIQDSNSDVNQRLEKIERFCGKMEKADLNLVTKPELLELGHKTNQEFKRVLHSIQEMEDKLNSHKPDDDREGADEEVRDDLMMIKGRLDKIEGFLGKKELAHDPEVTAMKKEHS